MQNNPTPSIIPSEGQLTVSLAAGVALAQMKLVNKKKSLHKVDDTITFKTIHKNLDELQETMTSYEKQENEKREIISGMDKLVKSMLKTTMVSQAIQTEEPE
jgi:hypothetical protein